MPFCVISLMAVVTPNEVFELIVSSCSRAPRASSIGCQSGAVLELEPVDREVIGAPSRPVDVIIQPAPAARHVTCSRPIWLPRTKT